MDQMLPDEHHSVKIHRPEGAAPVRPQTFDPGPGSRPRPEPEPLTRNPKPETRNPNLEIMKEEPATRNPEPQTLDAKN